MAIRDAVERYVLRTKRRLSGVMNSQNSPHAPGHQQQNSTTSDQQQIETTERSSSTATEQPEDRPRDARVPDEIRDTLKRLETTQSATTECLNEIKARMETEMSTLNGMLLVLKNIVKHLEATVAAPSGHIERCYFHDQFGRVSYTCRPPCSLYDPAVYSISKADGTFGRPKRATPVSITAPKPIEPNLVGQPPAIAQRDNFPPLSKPVSHAKGKITEQRTLDGTRAFQASGVLAPSIGANSLAFQLPR